jgi:hypothetical protein
MKLQPLPIPVFLFSPTSATNCSPVSAQLCLQAQKNQPHWLDAATSFCLSDSLFFFPWPRLHPSLHLLNLLTQTPNSL